MKLDFIYDGKTKLKDWWGKVKANFHTVQDEFNALDDKVSKEITDRQSADTLLQQNIDKEISDRQSEDTIIRGEITELQNTVESFGKPPLKLSDCKIPNEDAYNFGVMFEQGDKVYILNDVGDKTEFKVLFFSEVYVLTQPVLNGKKYIFEFVKMVSPPNPGIEDRNGLINVTSVDLEDMAEDINALKEQTQQTEDYRVKADTILHETLKTAKIYDYVIQKNLEYATGSQLSGLIVGSEFILYYDDFNAQSPGVNSDISTIPVGVSSYVFLLSDNLQANKAYKCKITKLVDTTPEYGSDGEIEVIGEFTATDAYKELNNKLEILYTPINHRNIFRGKNLGSTVTEAQKTAIQSGTFDDLFVGDYWTIDGINWRIVDMDYWMNVGLDNPGIIKHHLVIMPDKALYDYQMNDKDTNEGGYVGSLMYKTGLNQAKSTINNIFGDMILEHEEYFVNKVTDGKPSGTLWVTNATIDLPNEFMIFGANVSANTQLDSMSVNQLSLFRMAPQFINDRWGFWLRDVIVSPLGYNSFLYTSGGGWVTSQGSISTDELGVRPVFAIG